MSNLTNYLLTSLVNILTIRIVIALSNISLHYQICVSSWGGLRPFSDGSASATRGKHTVRARIWFQRWISTQTLGYSAVFEPKIGWYNIGTVVPDSDLKIPLHKLIQKAFAFIYPSTECNLMLILKSAKQSHTINTLLNISFIP